MGYEVVLRSQGANSGYAGRNIEARQDGPSYTKSGNTKSQLLIWYTNRCFQHTYDQKIVRWTNVTRYRDGLYVPLCHRLTPRLMQLQVESAEYLGAFTVN
jgi:hypothetical protein